MKQLTVKQLSETINVSEGTIRAWIMKPIDNKVYSSSDINYTNLVEKLEKYFNDFTTKFGFTPEEIEIVKNERTSTKQYLDVEIVKDLKSGTKIVLKNYSLQTNLTFLKYDKEIDTFIFLKDKNEECVGYFGSQLKKDNIRLELVEEK